MDNKNSQHGQLVEQVLEVDQAVADVAAGVSEVPVSLSVAFQVVSGVVIVDR